MHLDLVELHVPAVVWPTMVVCIPHQSDRVASHHPGEIDVVRIWLVCPHHRVIDTRVHVETVRDVLCSDGDVVGPHRSRRNVVFPHRSIRDLGGDYAPFLSETWDRIEILSDSHK